MSKFSWKLFCQTSSVHGLDAIYRNFKNAKTQDMMIWLVIFLCMVALSLCQSVTNLLLYFEFGVKTNIKYEHVNELDFPAITFCNENTFRKSVVGNTPVVSVIPVLIGNLKNLRDAAIENNKTCFIPGKPYPDILTMKLEYDRWSKKDIVELLEHFATNSDDSVLKCWWNNSPIKCNGLFANHPDTLGSCFTFNIHEDIVKAVREESGAVSASQFAFGMNITNYSSKKQSQFGSNYGLRLLLNVNQDDYCGIYRKWYGAGYRAYVHDPHAFASYYINPPLQLTPGYSFRVALKPVKFRRYTKHMGLCTDFVYLYLSPFSKVYDETSCYIQCGTEFIWNKCKCFPPYGLLYVQKAAQALGVPEETVKLCNNEAVSCIKSYENQLKQINYALHCQKCKRPCEEVKYTYLVTKTNMVASRWLELNTKNMTREQIRKNLIHINYFFDNMEMQIVEESQAYMFIDFLTYCGSIIGLFLGMSFMSVFELSYQLTLWMHTLIIMNSNRVVKLNQRRPTLMYGDNRRLSLWQRPSLYPSYGRRCSTLLSKMSLSVVEDLFDKETKDRKKS